MLAPATSAAVAARRVAAAKSSHANAPGNRPGHLLSRRRDHLRTVVLVSVGLSITFCVPTRSAPTDPVAEWQRTIASAVTTSVAPSQLAPPLREWSPGYWWSHYSLANTPRHRQCFGDATTLAPLPTACGSFGDATSGNRVMLVGDSRAYQWLPALDYWGRTRHWRVSALTKANCRPWSNTPYFSGAPGQRTGAPYPSCASFNRAVLTAMSSQRPSYVFMTAMRGRTGATAFETNQQITAGMKAFARLVQSRGATPVFVGPNPEWFASSGVPGDVFSPDCVAHHLTSLTHCVAVGATRNGRSGALEAGYFNAMVDAARSTASAYLSTPDLFCRRRVAVAATTPNGQAYDECPMLVRGTLVYLDRQHITREFALLSAPAFSALVDRVAPPPPG